MASFARDPDRDPSKLEKSLHQSCAVLAAIGSLAFFSQKFMHFFFKLMLKFDAIIAETLTDLSCLDDKLDLVQTYFTNLA